MSESIFFKLFAGVPLNDFGTIPLVPFGRWLLSVGIFLLSVGFYAERDGKVKMLSLYRCGTIPGWWGRCFGRKVRFGIKTAVLLMLVVLAYDMIMGNNPALSAGPLAKVGILWLFHSVSMASLFALLDIFPVRRFVPGTLFLLEGVTFIVGFRFRAAAHVMYGMWGMYLQSSLYESGGFPAGAVMTAEAVLPVVCFAVGWKHLRKETNLYL